jgi:hypothetical protein
VPVAVVEGGNGGNSSGITRKIGGSFFDFEPGQLPQKKLAKSNKLPPLPLLIADQIHEHLYGECRCCRGLSTM